MSCDPYTEAGYFETIGRMVEWVKQDVAELVLMGIQPSYPSEKYGYVVPKSANSQRPIVNSLPVARFTEKPTTAVAEELLE